MIKGQSLSHSPPVFFGGLGKSQLIIHQNFFGGRKMKDPEPMKIRGMEQDPGGRRRT